MLLRFIIAFVKIQNCLREITHIWQKQHFITVLTVRHCVNVGVYICVAWGRSWIARGCFQHSCEKKTEEQSLWVTAAVMKYRLRHVMRSLIVNVQLIKHMSKSNKCHTVAKTTKCLPPHALFYKARAHLFPVSPSAFLCFMIPLLTASHQTHKCLEVFGKALLNCVGRNVCAREIQWRDSTLWCLSWRTLAEKLLISFAQEW